MTLNEHEGELTSTTLLTKPLTIVQLSDLIEAYGDDQVLQGELANFTCSRNADVESFLHQHALRFEKAHKSRTYLAVNETTLESESTDLEIIGYFTLSLKHLNLGEAISKSRRKELHGLFVPLGNVVVGYLIGQLAKNDLYRGAAIGDQLLDAALGILRDQAQRAVGGRFVIIECAQQEKLLQFYQRNGFNLLQVDIEDEMAQLIRRIA